MTESYGDVFDKVARAVDPSDQAVICDDDTTTWAAFDRKSNALARALLSADLSPQAKVALYMRNGSDYLIGFVACLKARLAPFNINFRYGPAEIAYLIDNADAEAVIFDAEFASILPTRAAMPAVKVLFAARGKAPGATNVEDVYSGNGEQLSLARSADDIFLLYTGGTTGLPKGVIWPSGTLWNVLAASRALEPGATAPMTADALAEQIREARARCVRQPRYHIGPPLMHGTGLFSAISVLSRGGTVVCSGAHTFEAATALDAIVRHACTGIVIVGDAFARPILDALQREPARWNVGGVESVVSSGMMWSPDVKAGLLEFMPNATLADGLGASEAASIAFSVTTRDQAPGQAQFIPADAIVIDPVTHRPVEAGSGQVGLIAKAGDLPLGYYKDPERTAKTYVTIDGVRRMISGDHATIDADGSIRLLGRGSHCINTAGEKVYPEEVEQALKSHTGVADALVFGAPDPRLGQKIVSVVSADAGISEGALIAHVKQALAGYKAPKRIVFTREAMRGPNGKADYAAARAIFDAAD